MIEAGTNEANPPVAKTTQPPKIGKIAGLLRQPYLCVLLGAILIYIVGISWLHSLRIEKFMNGFDLAFYQQAIWNTTQGRFLEVSATEFSRSLFGTDFILIYLLFVPFYALLPSTLTLVLLETVVIAVGALPVYWLARTHLGERAALGFGLLYLLLPAVQNGNLYELRERQMVVSFLLFAFYFWSKGRLWPFAIAAALALACRPENGFVLIMLGVYGWLEKRHKTDRRLVWLPIVLGAVWFGVALLVIRSAAGGNFALGSTFAGGSPLNAVTTLFLDPLKGFSQLFPTSEVLIGKLLYLPLLLLPFGFLPLINPRPLLMALPPIGLNFLASQQREIQWNPFDYHYQASVIPWCFVAAIFAAAQLGKKWAAPRFGLFLTGGLVSLTLLLNIGLNLYTPKLEGFPPIKNGWARIIQAKPNNRAAEGRILLQTVPPTAPLAVTNLWAAQVPVRRELYFFIERPLYSMNPTANAQYVFADLRNSENATLVSKLQQSRQWCEIGQRAEYILLKKCTS